MIAVILDFILNSMKAIVQLFFATSIIISACTSKGQQQTNNEPAEFPVVEITQRDTVLHTDYVSDIQAVKNVEIRARVQGFLEKIFVDEGREVKKGQPLFRINDQEYVTELARAKAAVSSAMAEAKAAELEVDRVKVLSDKKIVSVTEYELAAARLKAAKAKVSEALSTETNAKTKLSYTYVLSPFDGVIDRIPLKLGSLVDAGALLTTISDVHEVYAYFHVSENEYLQYKKAQQEGKEQSKTIQLILADGTGYAHPGKIETIDGEFNDNTGAIAFRARFSNPSKLLKHGASGKVRLTSEVDDAILIPQKAVFEIQDKNYVFIVDENNLVKQRGFTTDKRVAQYYIVREGLKPGEKIVFEGIQNIRDGMKIKPRVSNADSLVAFSF